jgi:hypothetical protein
MYIVTKGSNSMRELIVQALVDGTATEVVRIGVPFGKLSGDATVYANVVRDWLNGDLVRKDARDRLVDEFADELLDIGLGCLQAEAELRGRSF